MKIADRAVTIQMRLANPAVQDEAFFEALQAVASDCPRCGAAPDRLVSLTRTFWRCGRCHTQFSIFSQRPFKFAKLPPEYFLAAIYLLMPEGGAVSGNTLHKLLGVQYRTAWRMRQMLLEAKETAPWFPALHRASIQLFSHALR